MMKRSPFTWLVSLAALIAAVVLIANSSLGQVQGGTGRTKTAGPSTSFNPPPNQ